MVIVSSNDDQLKNFSTSDRASIHLMSLVEFEEKQGWVLVKNCLNKSLCPPPLF